MRCDLLSLINYETFSFFTYISTYLLTFYNRENPNESSLFFLIMVSATMIISLSMFSSTYGELVYAQQEENQIDSIGIQ